MRLRPLLLASLAVSLASVGCSALHHTMLGDVEPAAKGNHVSIKVSETTLDFKELADLAKLGGSVFHSKGATNVGKGMSAYTTLFQFGPHTGTPVFTEEYARFVPELLRKRCPSGHVANIMSIRETREYPVVKGEIVRIEADCLK